MIVLIPAFRPDERLVALVTGLLSARRDLAVVVVDDGSGPDFAEVFAQAAEGGADVLHLSVNRGKGAALRTGFEHARTSHPGSGVVTADADGQHRVGDILRVAHALEETGTLVLGVREFSGEVPLRSQIGNDVTALLFRLSTGWNLADTQTGLRGHPAEQLEWLVGISGDRYEYELNVLLSATRSHLPSEQVPIETVYDTGNTSSHFRPVRDSLRIYAPLLAFSASSLAAFGVDLAVLLLLRPFFSGLLLPVICARIVSATVNHGLNRRIFRARKGTAARSGLRYGFLAIALVGASWGALTALTWLGLPLWAAKVVGDGGLYLLSFRVQQRFVFTPEAPRAQPRSTRSPSPVGPGEAGSSGVPERSRQPTGRPGRSSRPGPPIPAVPAEPTAAVVAWPTATTTGADLTARSRCVLPQPRSSPSVQAQRIIGG